MDKHTEEKHIKCDIIKSHVYMTVWRWATSSASLLGERLLRTAYQISYYYFASILKPISTSTSVWTLCARRPHLLLHISLVVRSSVVFVVVAQRRIGKSTKWHFRKYVHSCPDPFDVSLTVHSPFLNSIRFDLIYFIPSSVFFVVIITMRTGFKSRPMHNI